MIVGYNHNINYRGTVFHVQTEDSGLKKPHIVTLLYHGGTILSSQKTEYADIIKVDDLEQVIIELAQDQHKGMLKQLTAGNFDERIVTLNIPLEGYVAKAVETTPETPLQSAVEGSAQAESESAMPSGSTTNSEIEITSLDEVVLAYLTAGSC